MKLSNQQIKDLFEAHTRLLDGRPRLVTTDGKQQVVSEPYGLSQKVRWNAAKNRAILRRITEVIDEEYNATARRLRTFQAMMPTPNPDLGKEHIEAEALANGKKMQIETDRENVEFGKLLDAEEEVTGLLKLPVAGLGDLKKNPYGAFLEVLLPLIEGEPDFGDDKAPE